MKLKYAFFYLIVILIPIFPSYGQIGTRFPSERKVIKDPITGSKLVFLTSKSAGDQKIYQTHNQWTSDGQWLVFRSDRVKGEAMAVNEKTGVIVQVTEGGYIGMLNVARRSMKLYYMRKQRGRERSQEVELIEVDLERLFADSKANKLQSEASYQRVCGLVPAEMEAGGDMALDADEDWIWFRLGKDAAAKYLPDGVEVQPSFGPRNMGAGPGGIAGINIHTGEVKHVVSVPFQIGHVQSNPWVSGQIIFCWETGGKSPQRTWIVNADGTGLRPLYPEADYEWITHEAVISSDEVAFAIMGHRPVRVNEQHLQSAGTGVNGANPGQEVDWGNSGTREKPTGLGIVNIETREMYIAGQIPFGSGFWHVSGSSDKRFVVGDDFARNIYLIDRRSGEMILLSTGHKATAADHPHPTFSPDGTKIQIQTAMLSDDNRTMNICVISVPKRLLKKK